jgi:hypothetical protein
MKLVTIAENWLTNRDHNIDPRSSAVQPSGSDDASLTIPPWAVTSPNLATPAMSANVFLMPEQTMYF